jgi:hypothetical protein
MTDKVERIAFRWFIKPAILRDVYFLMCNDPRFYSTRRPYGIKYMAMSRHLWKAYKLEINERQLRYLVKQMRPLK